ncbi:MAG: hypothetical protein ACK5MR_17025 [Cumulibacter sp.]
MSGNHGYNITLENEPVGSHTYCVFAIDNERTTSNPLLRCRTIDVKPTPKAAPIGKFDSATYSSAGVKLTGWTIDMDSPNQTGYVAVYRDGQGLGWQPTDQLRSDANAAYGVSGTHGFNIVLTDQPSGSHQYCIMAIDNERVTTNPLLRCRTVTIP